MFSDLKFIILWGLTVFSIGCLSLPLITYIFRNFWDKGYVFSKITSLAIVTYFVFVLGVFKILPFNQYSILGVITLFGIIEYILLKKVNYWPEFFRVVKNKLPVFIFEEILFFSILIIWSFVRGHAPDIEGLEKFMDWGFVNSILRTKYFPPVDMWFSGESINYYYFGHIIFALITKLTNIPSAISYNLSIALVCALTFISTFSLSSNLAYLFIIKSKHKIKISKATIFIAGMVSALLLTFGGNLHSIYKITKINIKNNGHLELTAKAFENASKSYWYPDATRFIGFDPDIKDKTIHEFPLYSFVVSDLHGHMNDIPMVLFIVAFILAMSTSSVTLAFISWPLVVPLGLMLSIAYMTNAWDFAVYGLVFAVISFLTNKSIIRWLINGFVIILLWYIFTLPYNLNFVPMAEGLRLSDSHTPFYQLFVLYGGFWLISFPFFIIFIKKIITRSKMATTDLFVLGLLLTVTALIIIPEIGYIKDIYIYDHRRANTMFKLVYQAFMIYSVCAGYILVRLRKYILYKFIFGLILSLHLLYPYFAIKSYYNELKTYQGLSGLGFMQKNYSDNYQAYLWIQKNITGQPVMLEAVGDSYTDFNQMSMSTGLPTIEGWIVHEWLWRGGYDKPSARQADVLKIYTSENQEEVNTLLQKYSVEYIFVGTKEYEKYPIIKEKNFIDLGAKIVFQFGSTKIYKLAK